MAATKLATRHTCQSNRNDSSNDRSYIHYHTYVATTSALYCVTTKFSVLLQTTRAMVFKISDVEMRTEARIMFDNGSQWSYVTNTLTETLSLTFKHTKTMAIKHSATDQKLSKSVMWH